MYGDAPALPLQSLGAPTWVVVAVAVGVGSLLVATGVLTVGYSLLRAARRRRDEATASELREALFGRLYGSDDPDWESWVVGLSPHERSVLETVLDDAIREVSGQDADALVRLGHALGVPERARAQLEAGSTTERLDALTWLALLRDPPDVETLEAYCTATPQERAAAVRALHRSGHPALGTVGVDLLLTDTTTGLSVFGIDTLYRVAETDPVPLSDRAATDVASWSPGLTAQVLLTMRHVTTVAGGVDLSWVVSALSAAEARSRAVAARALGGYGWHASLRADIDLAAACADPSPTVRASVYRMLGEWGDDDALETLVSAAATETDQRARIAAAEALVPHHDRVPADLHEVLGEAWAWASAHAAFDDRATTVSREVRH